MQPNVEENFKFWKKIAGLSQLFPDLLELDDDKFTYISDQEKIDEIYLRITNPLISVIVKRGHGCSTLFNYVYRLILKDSLTRKIIPIKIYLKDLWENEAEFASKDLEANIKKEILYTLIKNNSWEKVLTSQIYNNIIGGYERKTNKEVHINAILMELDQKKINWDSLRILCPKFKSHLNVIIQELSSKHQISIVLFFDIPFHVDSEHLEVLIGAIKDLHQEYKDLPGLSEIYFITPEHFEQMQSSNPRIFEKIEYNSEGYYFNQIIKILSLRYRPLSFQTIKEIEDPLLIVFDQKFAEMAWKKEKTLHEIIEEMKNLILKSLNCEKQDIPFKLEPRREQIQKWERENGR